MRIEFSISLPDELAKEFFQHLRDFDTKHDPHKQGKVQMAIWASSEHTTAQIEEMMRAITPGFEFVQSFLKKEGS